MAHATVNPVRSMRTFMIIWLGQIISLIGTGLTGFALGVWVYQLTGSTTQFALIGLFSVLPSILVAPLAGALVDRWNHRTTLVVSDCVSALAMLVVALLLLTNRLNVWHLYIALGIRSVVSAFQWPAYTAATTILVPKQQLTRVNSILQIGQSASLIISPLLGGLLLASIALWGVILLDLLTYLFAITALLSIRIPTVAAPQTSSTTQRTSLWQEVLYGWEYIVQRPGLLGLLIFFAVTNFSLGIVQVLITPLALSIAPTEVVGTIQAIGGTGVLIGSIALSAWGGPRRRIYGVLGFTLLQGLLLFLGGLRPNVPLIAAATFAYLFCFPIVVNSSQAIWQSKIALNVQGRVFAIRRMIALSALPLCYLVAGPLADQVFEPLLAENGLLANSVGRVIGVGPGRGIGLLFIVLGVFTVLAVIIGFLYRPIRQLEDDLPDVIPDDVPSDGQIVGNQAT